MLFSTGGQRTLSQTTYTPWQSVRLLVVLFCLWKVVLFTVIVLAPGPGYDTSSTLLVDHASQSATSARVGDTTNDIPRLLKFVRWDAIYFTQITQRQYVFEQEWAFGPGFPGVVAFFRTGIYSQAWMPALADM